MSNNLSNRIFDVVVIGGGITGLGVALESARCGFTTVILEKSEICHETSDNSLRIFHGGLRYLQELNIFKVIESLQEQHFWLKDAPSLIKRLPCIMPLKENGMKGHFVMSYAAKFYNYISELVTKKSNGASILNAEFLQKYCPVLKSVGSRGGFLWNDARIRDPLKFAALVRHRIDREGGEISEGVEVKEVLPMNELFAVNCRKNGEDIELISRVVINAAGAGMNQISYPRKRPLETRFCRAFNLVLSQKIQDRFALGVHTKSGRLLFAVPRSGRTAIGTEYLPYHANKSVSDEEVQTFLNEFNSALPDLNLSLTDVEKVEVGLLPMAGIDPKTGLCRLLKSAKIIDHLGFIDVVSTKYTTFRSLGKKVVKKAIKYLR